MSYIMRNNNKYAGGSGGNTNSVDLTMNEYEELKSSGKVLPDTTYYITDESVGNEAENVVYDNSVSNLNATNVQDAIDVLNSKLVNENNETFNFGVKDGVRGFFTDPSRADDSFVPFKSGGGDADSISYDNSISGINADNVQDAIDEQQSRIVSLERGFGSVGDLLDVQTGSWKSDTLSYNNQQQYLVVFDKQFKNIPTVNIAIKTKLAPGNYSVTVSNISEASFTITFKVTTNATFAMELDWIAEAPASSGTAE